MVEVEFTFSYVRRLGGLVVGADRRKSVLLENTTGEVKFFASLHSNHDL